MSTWMQARSTRQSVPVVAVQVLADALDKIGGDVDDALTRSGLPHVHHLLDADDGGQVSRDGFTRFFESCLLSFHDHNSRRDGFSPLSKEAFRMMCVAVLACPDLRVAIETAGRFQDMLMGGSGRLTLTVRDGVAHLNANATARRVWLGDMVVALHSLAASSRLFSWLIGQEIDIQRITLKAEGNSSQDAFNEMLQIRPEFNQPHDSVEFPEIYLRHPIVRRYDELAELFTLFPFDLYATEQSSSLVERVGMATESALIRGDTVPGMAQLARMFGLTVPTFRRRIAAEQTSLCDIRRRCKQDLAVQWLSDLNLGVKEIASRLQFSDVASFRRAFRSWTGVSPFAFRSRGPLPGPY